MARDCVIWTVKVTGGLGAAARGRAEIELDGAGRISSLVLGPSAAG